MKLSIKQLIAKLPFPFWVSFYIFLILIAVPTIVYLGNFSDAAPGTLTVSIDQKQGTNDPNPSYTSVFTVQFSEPIDKSTFTNPDITLGGTAPGQQIQSITEAGTFNKTTYEVRIQATGAGTITPTIAQDTITAQNGPSGTNQASTSTDNSVTYNGDWAPGEFIIKVKTDNPGVTSSNQIRIPTTGGGYNYNVDWGDGNTSTGHTGDATHTYSSVGTYTVKISGMFPRVYFNDGGDKKKLLTIEQWGNNAWDYFARAFKGCSNLTILAIDAPNLSNVNNMSEMFFYASNFNDNINHWNVSNIIITDNMLNNAISFNQPINSWNVSNVVSMNGMFAGATSFNQPLDNWDVKKVTEMRAMFSYASSFNQPLNSWNVSNVTAINMMFNYATSFNQPLNNWNVGNVTQMWSMFSSATNFNQPLNSWNVSNVVSMNNMFNSAISFNQPINSWNVSNVTNMSQMFSSAGSFNQSLNNWNVSNVTNMSWMFNGTNSFNQSLASWNVSNTIDMSGMFYGAGLSTVNYDNTLIGWSSRNLKSNVTFNAGTSKYCTSAVERQSIITNHSWTITDGGQDCASTRAPQVETNSATNITDISATLNGVTSPDTITARGFQYGTTNSYGSTATDSSATISTYGLQGSGNGQFGFAYGVATDSSGNVYVADSANHRIQKFDANGNFLMKFGTNGSGNGQLNAPDDVSIDSSGNIYVADSLNHRIQKFNSSGTYLSQFGTNGSGNGQFNTPASITFDTSGNIYVADQDNHRIQKFDSNGTYLSQFGTNGSGNGQFANPHGVTVDTSGNIYVADTSNHRIQKFDSNGAYITKWGSAGSGNGQFNHPSNTAVDKDGNVYVMDFLNHRVQKFSSNGFYISQFGSGGSGLTEFTFPHDLAFSTNGNLYIQDNLGYRLKRYTGTITANISGLTCGTSYHYRAYATNSYGTGYGDDQTFATNACPQDPFIMTIKTDNPGISQYTIPTNNGNYTYNYNVDCNNDGTNEFTNQTGNVACTYGSAGEYDIAISGIFPHLKHPISGDQQKIIDVKQWGDIAWQNMENMFADATNITTFTATDTPDLSQVLSMYNMFRGATSFNSNINNWDVSNVTNMGLLFAGAQAFNQPLNNWDVSNVTNASGMFAYADSFNQSLNSWNTGNLVDTSYMFAATQAFNQPLNNWNTGNIVDASYMFATAKAFNQDINNWDVSNVTTMKGMFGSTFDGSSFQLNDYTTIFNQPLNNWDVSSVTDMDAMFNGAKAFNQNISNWNVGNVTIMTRMFMGAQAFNQPVDSWNMSNVQNIGGIFALATHFNQPLNSWDTSSLTDISGAFAGTFNFNQPLNNWDTSNVRRFYATFSGAKSFNQPLDSWDVSNVNEMQYMFGELLNSYKSMFEQILGKPYSQWTQAEKDYFYTYTSFFTGYTIAESDPPVYSGLSTPNYDATLIAWSAQNLEPNVTFDAGTSKYCDSKIQRQSIITNFGWTINDDGICQLSPSAPLSPFITEITTTSMQFNWSPPADDGNSPITSYQVQYKASSSGAWISAPAQSPSPTTNVLTNLSPGTSYDFRVAAINAIGTSPYTNPITGTTMTEPILPNEPPPPPNPEDPDPPVEPPVLDPETPTTNEDTNTPEPGTPIYSPQSTSRPKREKPLSILGFIQKTFDVKAIVSYAEYTPRPIARATPYSLLSLLVAIALFYGYSSYMETKRRRSIQALITRFKSMLSARATYLRITSHYISTPITKMQGTIELLSMGVTSGTPTSSTSSNANSSSNTNSTAITNSSSNTLTTNDSANTPKAGTTISPTNPTTNSHSGSNPSSNNSSSSNQSASTNSSNSNQPLPPPVALAASVTTLTIPEDSIVAAKSGLKSLANHSAELLAEGQSLTGAQQANIRNLEQKKGLSFLTNPSFWLPVVVISTIVVLLNFIFIQANRYTPTAITILSQLLLGFVGVIALGVSYYFYRQQKATTALLQTEQTIEQEFNTRQANFISEASNKLSDDLLLLDGISKDIAKYPKTTGFTDGLKDLKQIVAQLEKLSQLSKYVPGLNWSTDLSQTISNTTKDLDNLANKQSVTITTNNLTPSTLVAIESSALNHLIAAPLKNAIQASNPGNQVTITQTTNPKDKLHPITLTITDQGKGIPANKLQDIFTPFNSAHSLERFTDTGLGLDLYLAKVVTEAYGATIDITSQENVGTTVAIGLGRAE